MPSEVQFTGRNRRHNHNGDDIRRAMLDLGVVEDRVLVLPSAVEISKSMGLKVSGLAAIGHRLGYSVMHDTLSAAAGCPVRPVNGYIVDLSHLPVPVTNGDVAEAQDAPTWSGIASYVTDRLDNPQQLDRLASELVRQAGPTGAIEFAQRLLYAATNQIIESGRAG